MWDRGILTRLKVGRSRFHSADNKSGFITGEKRQQQMPRTSIATGHPLHNFGALPSER
jgi:hypothetical protein